MKPDRRNVLLCTILLGLAVVLTRPIVELGINDEWSYARTAFAFAHTGHIVYNGWASPILIPQILWSAPFVRLFGDSFFALRLSTILLGLACVPVLYFLARDCGLLPEFAVFATLLSALAPVFLPEVVTYMTDVQGFLPFLICLYASVRASQSQRRREFARWILLIALSGLCAGLVRQVFFAAPILFLLALAWLCRRRFNIAGPIAGAAATLAVALGALHWYAAQPYAIPDTTAAAVLHEPVRAVLSEASLTVARFLGSLPLFLLPLLAAFFVATFRIVERKWWIPAFALASILSWILVRDPERSAPWLGNIVTNNGIFSPAAVAMGERAATLTPLTDNLLSFAVFLGVAAVALVLAKLRRAPVASENQQALDAAAAGHPGPGDPTGGIDAMHAFLAMGLPFAIISLLLIAVRSYFVSVFDRYLIPILPLCSIPLLWIYQTRVRDRLGGAAWSLLGIFSLFAVAGTHDLFADYRARLQLLDAVEGRGVPRTEILGGLEYDGWTQTAITGYINHWFLDESAHREIKDCSGGAPLKSLWYRELIPEVTPRYFLTFSRLPNLIDSPIPPVEYSSWLPPRHRSIWIQMLPDGSLSVCRFDH